MEKNGISMTNKTRNSLIGLSFLLVWIIGFLAFTLYPIIYSLILSVCDLKLGVNGISLNFVGIKYYYRAFREDTVFLPGLIQSISFIVYATPIIIVVALLLAMMLKNNFRGRGFFRAIFFMPVVIMSGPVISELLGKYSVDFSVTTPALYTFINALPNIFKSPCMFVLDNLVTVLWYSGVQILILLISIQRIGPELYEAASIDGAGGWEKFWKITLPYVLPTALICALYTIVELANDSSNSINSYINKMMQTMDGYYSFSTAMSWIYSLAIMLLLLLVFIIFVIFNKKEKGENEN